MCCSPVRADAIERARIGCAASSHAARPAPPRSCGRGRRARARRVARRPAADPAASSASASASNGRGPGRTTATRQASTSAATPAAVSRGTSPARTSDDLPAPPGPTTSRNGCLRSARGLEPVDRARHVGRAAEEHRRMLQVEGRQPAKRRALDRDRPDHGAAGQHLGVEPFTQPRVDLVPRTGRRSRSFGPRRRDVRAGRGIAARRRTAGVSIASARARARHRRRWRRAAARSCERRRCPDVVVLPCRHRGQHVIGRRARIGLVVGHAREVARRSAPSRDQKIAITMSQSAAAGSRSAAPPARRGPTLRDGLDANDAGELAVESRRHSFDAPTLVLDVAGR